MSFLYQIFRIFIVAIYGLFSLSPIFAFADSTLTITSTNTITPCQLHIVCSERGEALECHLAPTELSSVPTSPRHIPCGKTDESLDTPQKSGTLPIDNLGYINQYI